MSFWPNRSECGEGVSTHSGIVYSHGQTDRDRLLNINLICTNACRKYQNFLKMSILSSFRPCYVWYFECYGWKSETIYVSNFAYSLRVWLNKWKNYYNQLKHYHRINGSIKFNILSVMVQNVKKDINNYIFYQL